MSLYSRRLVLMLVALITLVGAVGIPMIAQEDNPEDPPIADGDVLFTVEGEVMFVDSEIVVGNMVIAPAGAFNPSELEEGDLVSVTGYLLNDDTLQAVSLEFIDAEECDEEVDAEECDDPVDDEECDEAADGEECDNDGDEDDEECDEAADDEECDADGDEADDEATHPIAEILANEFDLDVEDIIAYHSDGLGYGEIARVLLIADQVEDMDVDSVLEMLGEGSGWGQIMRELDIHPRDLAPGRVISGRYNNEDDGEDGENLRGNGNANNGNGNGRGNGNNGNGRGNGNGNGNNGGGNGNGNGNNGGGNGNGNGGGRGGGRP